MGGLEKLSVGKYQDRVGSPGHQNGSDTLIAEITNGIGGFGFTTDLTGFQAVHDQQVDMGIGSVRTD